MPVGMHLVSVIRNRKTGTVHAQGDYLGGTKCGAWFHHIEFLYDEPADKITCRKCRDIISKLGMRLQT